MASLPNRVPSAVSAPSPKLSRKSAGRNSTSRRRAQSADRKSLSKRLCKCKSCTMKREVSDDEFRKKNPFLNSPKTHKKSSVRRSYSNEESQIDDKKIALDSPKQRKSRKGGSKNLSNSDSHSTKSPPNSGKSDINLNNSEGWFIPANQTKNAQQIVTELRAEALEFLTDKTYPKVEPPKSRYDDSMRVIELDPLSLPEPPSIESQLGRMSVGIEDIDPFQFSRSNTEYTCCSSILFQEMTDYLNQSMEAPEDPWPTSPSSRKEVIHSKLGSRVDNTPGDVIQWKRGQMLGRGAFGTVWCGLTMTGEMIAVKQSDIATTGISQSQREYEKIQSEVNLLKSLNHENIVAYLGTSMQGCTVSIFMQYIPGGCLASILRKFGSLNEAVCSRYTKQILNGVAHLHSKGIIHRDIKGSNIMLMPNGVVKLIDFGCAQRLLHLNKDSTQLNQSCKGTPYWMAPEVINETKQGPSLDIWSIGCTIIEMLGGKPPWAHLNKYAALYAISQGQQPQSPPKISPDADDIISKCLANKPNERPAAESLTHHSFIVLHEMVNKNNSIHDKHGQPRKSAKIRQIKPNQKKKFVINS